MRRTFLILLLCATAVGLGNAAERIEPPFFIDTETTAFLPYTLGLNSSLKSGPSYFGISQDLSLVEPSTTLGIGVRAGIERLPIFDALSFPIHALASIGYNLKLGGGFEFFPNRSALSTATAPEGTVTSFLISYSWQIAEVGPTFLGLSFGLRSYHWKYTDSFGDAESESGLSGSIGVSLAFDPKKHPINRNLYPKYTGSFD